MAFPPILEIADQKMVLVVAFQWHPGDEITNYKLDIFRIMAAFDHQL